MSPIPRPHPLSQRVLRALTRTGTRRRWRALLALLVVVVSYLALSPKPPPSIDLGWDKLNHLSAFAAMAVAAWLGDGGPWRRRAVWLGALLAFGGLIELLQTQVPGRSAEWADLLADALGIVLGAVLAAAVVRAAPRRASN